ncbi:MAG: DNA repair protein RecO [Magnetococcales bacterium]|nr:DNA repair protein RecO [Magnetococcales bacterium]NGZ28598.1 DNA repair protein RecO [Magnetococcales bacterium]
MITLADEALVLRRIPYGETSLVVHFFTRNHGLMAAMAKGARGIKSAHRAPLAAMHTLTVQLRLRDMTGMATLHSADILYGRHGLTASPLCLAAAQVATEAVYRGVASGDGNQPLFHALSQTLDGLNRGQSPAETLAKGLAQMLTAMGYGFDMQRCHRCETGTSSLAYSWQSGQMVCSACCRGERFLLLSESACRAFAGSQGEVSLSGEETSLLYRLAVATLEKHGKAKLVSDTFFRQYLGW